MNSVRKTSIVLGIAFLLELITNVVNGMLLRPLLITTGNIIESMANIAIFLCNIILFLTSFAMATRTQYIKGIILYLTFLVY